MTGHEGLGRELGDRFDVLVIGAGFSGLYMLHRLRLLGLLARVLEMAESVATGFDAMTGALSRIDIRGRGRRSLARVWAGEGPLSYLGLAVAGFGEPVHRPGPGLTSAATNFVAALEQHVEWIGDGIAYLRANGIRTIEALAGAQQEWIEHTTALVGPTVLVHPSRKSWYNGGNVPGKKRMYMGYVGGIPEYRRRCDEIAVAGYTGFTLG
jgi:cation diffusion facilitator CzcD-associated flavoprotein CzcO